MTFREFPAEELFQSIKERWQKDNLNMLKYERNNFMESQQSIRGERINFSIKRLEKHG